MFYERLEFEGVMMECAVGQKQASQQKFAIYSDAHFTLFISYKISITEYI